MKTKTNVKAGGRDLNENQTLVSDSGLKVRSNLKVGKKSSATGNHNQTLVQAGGRAKRLRVKSGVKTGRRK